jgi:hypothetical protein
MSKFSLPFLFLMVMGSMSIAGEKDLRQTLLRGPALPRVIFSWDENALPARSRTRDECMGGGGLRACETRSGDMDLSLCDERELMEYGVLSEVRNPPHRPMPTSERDLGSARISPVTREILTELDRRASSLTEESLFLLYESIQLHKFKESSGSWLRPPIEAELRWIFGEKVLRLAQARQAENYDLFILKFLASDSIRIFEKARMLGNLNSDQLERIYDSFKNKIENLRRNGFEITRSGYASPRKSDPFAIFNDKLVYNISRRLWKDRKGEWSLQNKLKRSLKDRSA